MIVGGSNVIEGNRTFGILLLGSSADVSPGQTIRGNGSGLMSHRGIAASRASNLRLSSSQVINNFGQGIYVGENSMAVLAGNTINGNQAEGVRVRRLSTAWLAGPPNAFAGNGGFDFFCAPDSVGFGSRDGVGKFYRPAFDQSPNPSPDGP